MKIDPEVNVMDLLTNWVNGNRKDVLCSLENDHPGLTAMFLITGIGEKMLSRTDCNIVTNLLMDQRIEKAQSDSND